MIDLYLDQGVMAIAQALEKIAAQLTRANNATEQKENKKVFDQQADSEARGVKQGE